MKHVRGIGEFARRLKNAALVIGGFFVVLFGVSKAPHPGIGSQVQVETTDAEGVVYADIPYVSSGDSGAGDSGVTGGDSASGDSGGDGGK